MKTKSLLIASLALAFLMTSCGNLSITQKRYSRGLNISLFRAKSEPAKENTAQLRKKRDVAAPAAEQLSTETMSALEQSSVTVKENSPALVVSKSSDEIKNTGKNKVNSGKKASTGKKVSKRSIMEKIADAELAPNAEKNIESVRLAQKSAKAAKRNYWGDGEKSQWTAALWCFFAGGWGIHRFYLGYYWIGVLFFLTGGFGGIWTLIDFIRILMGRLTPRWSDYTERI